MGEPCRAVHVSHEIGQGGEDGGGGGGDDRVSETEGSLESGAVSSESLCSSRSSLTDDDATSPLTGDRKSSSSSSSDSMQLDGDGDGDGGGPLYELSPLLAHLPVRTGLSKYYQRKSQSFASLSDAKYVEDLAKKTIPYNYAAAGLGANRSSNSRNVPGLRSKTITKKTPRGSSRRLLSRARNTRLLHGCSKPPEMGHLSTGVRISSVSKSLSVELSAIEVSRSKFCLVFLKQVLLSFPFFCDQCCFCMLGLIWSFWVMLGSMF